MALTVTFNPAVFNGSAFGTGSKQCDVLSSLTYDGHTLDFAGNGGLTVEGVAVIDIDPDTGKSTLTKSNQFDGECWITVARPMPTQLRATLTFAKFATFTATYTAGADRLDIELVVINPTKRQWVCMKSVKLLGMPVAAASGRGFGIGYEPTVIELATGFATAVVLPDAHSRKWFGLFGGRLMVGDGRPPYVQDNALPTPAYPLKPDGSVRDLSTVRGALGPGESETTTISLRFGPKGTAMSALAPDYVASYRSAHPPRPNWPDRRPIGAIFLGDHGRVAAAYKNAAKKPDDWNGSAFRAAVLQLAADCVFGAKDCDMQGVIVWDFERPVTGTGEYVGSPRQAGTRCPAWNRHAPDGRTLRQEFVQTFTSAGLRFGVTVRGQDYKPDNSYTDPVVPSDDTAYQPGDELPQAVTLIIDKIMDVMQMGGTLVYLDSAGPLLTKADPTWFGTICRLFPDILIIPEMSDDGVAGVSARYVEARRGEFGVLPGLVRDIYPDAFAAVQAFDAGNGYDLARSTDRLRQSIAQGNVLLIKPYVRQQVAAVRALYSESTRNGR